MHWLIVIGVVVVLFGAKRLPEAARSLGRSARILKAEVREMGDGETPAAERPPITAAQPRPAGAEHAPADGTAVGGTAVSPRAGSDAAH